MYNVSIKENPVVKLLIIPVRHTKQLMYNHQSKYTAQRIV